MNGNWPESMKKHYKSVGKQKSVNFLVSEKFVELHVLMNQ